MSYEIFSALVVFAFVSSITPGPNNAMLMASGANFGVVRSVPHMSGVGIGFAVMIALVGMGLMQVFDLFPVLDTVLKVLSVLYLVWLAWKIGTAAPKLPSQPETGGRPFSFLQAAGFQWVNPKAWTMGVYAITNFATDPGGTRSMLAVGIVAGVFLLLSVLSVSTWTILGQQMQRFLTSPARLRSFNVVMAVLLLLTLWPVVFAPAT